MSLSFSWLETGLSLLSFLLSLLYLAHTFFSSNGSKKRRRKCGPRHKWRSSQFPWALRCICCSLVVSDWRLCLYCGATVCTGCAMADSLCKRSEGVEDSYRHQWVETGLVEEAGVCVVCKEDEQQQVLQYSHDDIVGVIDYYDHKQHRPRAKCCWCQRSVHVDCLDRLDKESECCDLGEFADFILPAGSVDIVVNNENDEKEGNEKNDNKEKNDIKEKNDTKVKNDNKEKNGNKEKKDDTSIRFNKRVRLSPSSTPLIVMAHRKAGNNEGSIFLDAFRAQLNPLQVMDLTEFSPETALGLCQSITTHQCIVLVGGGDGSVSWVLNAMDSLSFAQRPLLAVLPLGTGNDLSRSLGFGAEIKTKREDGSIEENERFMQNYLGIGMDAAITYNFHVTREQNTLPFTGRMFNKLLYFVYGTKDVLAVREYRDFDKRLQIHLDGKKIEHLPNFESIIVLNTPSWSAGCRPWRIGRGHEHYDEASFNDGKLEIFAIYNGIHIAQMQLGVAEPHRIGQAREICLELTGKSAMQTDGEPWIQEECVITISNLHKVPVLVMDN